MALTMTIEDFFDNVTKTWEKGKVNHKDDPGGATNDGVATHFITDFAQKEKNITFLRSIGIEPTFVFGKANAKATKETLIFSTELLMSFTPEQCRSILIQEFWVNGRLINVDSKLAAYATFDFCVNSGVNRGLKYLQTAANALGTGTKLDVDGILGPKSYNKLATFASPLSKDLNLALDVCNRRMTFLKGLSTWGTFGKGWTNRVNGVISFLKGYNKWVK